MLATVVGTTVTLSSKSTIVFFDTFYFRSAETASSPRTTCFLGKRTVTIERSR